MHNYTTSMPVRLLVTAAKLAYVLAFSEHGYSSDSVPNKIVHSLSAAGISVWARCGTDSTYAVSIYDAFATNEVDIISVTNNSLGLSATFTLAHGCFSNAMTWVSEKRPSIDGCVEFASSNVFHAANMTGKRCKSVCRKDGNETLIYEFPDRTRVTYYRTTEVGIGISVQSMDSNTGPIFGACDLDMDGNFDNYTLFRFAGDGLVNLDCLERRPMGEWHHTALPGFPGENALDEARRGCGAGVAGSRALRGP